MSESTEVGTVHVAFDEGRVVLDLQDSQQPKDWLAATPHDRAEYAKTGTVFAFVAPEGGTIETPEGVMSFSAGDYIATDNPPTHVWPIKKDIFERTYAPPFVEAVEPPHEHWFQTAVVSAWQNSGGVEQRASRLTLVCGCGETTDKWL